MSYISSGRTKFCVVKLTDVQQTIVSLASISSTTRYDKQYTLNGVSFTCECPWDNDDVDWDDNSQYFNYAEY
ncbi:MAG TPA: hypothetical protein VFM18_19115 [Methanosarcina sp.]|nr:hypothetical protein [Methanosarcina sp.]